MNPPDFENESWNRKRVELQENVFKAVREILEHSQGSDGMSLVDPETGTSILIQRKIWFRGEH